MVEDLILDELMDLDDLDALADGELEMDDLDFADIDMSELAGVAELGMEPLGAAGLADDEDDEGGIDFNALKADDSDDLNGDLQ
jgi:hypothetical protein